MAEWFSSLLLKYRAKIDSLSRNKHFTYGLPFLILVVGGSFVLKEFAKIRYEFTQVNPFELPVDSKVKTTKIDPEKEFDNIMSKINIDNWENKRIPRPWDEAPGANKN